MSSSNASPAAQPTRRTDVGDGSVAIDRFDTAHAMRPTTGTIMGSGSGTADSFGILNSTAVTGADAAKTKRKSWTWDEGTTLLLQLGMPVLPVRGLRNGRLVFSGPTSLQQLEHLHTTTFFHTNAVISVFVLFGAVADPFYNTQQARCRPFRTPLKDRITAVLRRAVLDFPAVGTPVSFRGGRQCIARYTLEDVDSMLRVAGVVSSSRKDKTAPPPEGLWLVLQVPVWWKLAHTDYSVYAFT